MGDVLGNGVLRADGARVDAVGLAGLGERVVARVEVLALLEVLGEVVGAGGELAVEAEEALFLGGEGLGSLVSWMLGPKVERRGVGERAGGRRWCCVVAWFVNWVWGRGVKRTLTSTLFFWCGFIIAATALQFSQKNG